MHDNVNIVSTEQKLLFDIRELLIAQNKLLTIKPIDTIKVGEECSLCGGNHDNVGIRLACARKYKNKGDK